MATIEIMSEFITLAQALKVATVVGTGGEAKNLVRDGAVKVNGETELQPGRKLRPGDRFAVADAGEWVVAPAQ